MFPNARCRQKIRVCEWEKKKEERRRKREATTKRRIAWRLEKITEARDSRLIRACVKAGKNGSPLLGRMEGWKREEGGGEKFEKCTAPFFIIRLPSSISEGGKRVSTLPRNPWPAPSLFTILTNPLLLMALPWLCRLMAARSINRNSIPALRGPRRSNE